MIASGQRGSEWVLDSNLVITDDDSFFLGRISSPGRLRFREISELQEYEQKSAMPQDFM